MRHQPNEASASWTLLYSYLVLLAAIMLGLWGASAWRVVGVTTLFLMLPVVARDGGSGFFRHRQGCEQLHTLERAVTLANALVFAMACYVIGRGVGWLLTA
jgi:hypothetical protein